MKTCLTPGLSAVLASGWRAGVHATPPRSQDDAFVARLHDADAFVVRSDGRPRPAGSRRLGRSGRGGEVSVHRRILPDGRFVFVNARYAGGPELKPPNRFPRGTVSVIRLDAQRDDQGRPLHLVTAHELVGRGPGGMAISPDGRRVVSVDMQGSYFPPSDSRRTRCSTLTLLRCDAAAGTLDRIGSFDFDGLLPESAVFDRSGRHLAVANFGDLDDPTAPGTVDFWRVIPDPLDAGSVRLVQTHRSIALQRGVMQLNIPGQF